MADVRGIEDAIVEQLRQRIRHLLLTDEYLPAITLCWSLLEVAPEQRPLVKGDLTLALRNWGENLTDDEDHEEKALLMENYHRAVCLFPDSELLRNNMGGFLFKMGYPKVAMQYLWSVLQQNPDFLKARENLDNICDVLVERWHFRMLNDVGRNQCYQTVIQKALQQYPETSSERPALILDIGTGTGLLSMFAVLASDNVEVFGCEMSETMYEICCNVLVANDLSDRIRVIEKSSNDIGIPEDLPRKADIVTTETFDSGFFGEHILFSLNHAWDNLMNEKCLVIPYGATVYVAAVECSAIRQENRLLYKNADCIDLSRLEVLCSTGNHDLCDLYQLNIAEKNINSLICKSDETDFEPYSSEFLNRLPRGFRWLSCPQIITKFYLNDRQQVKLYKEGWKTTIELDVTECGQLDAFVVWFDLHVSQDHVLTTSPVLMPDSEASGVQGCCQAVCWEQAIFPFLSNHLDPGNVRYSEGVFVHPGNKLVLDVNIQDALHLNCCQVAEADRLSDCCKPCVMTDCDNNAGVLESTENDLSVSDMNGVPVSASLECVGAKIDAADDASGISNKIPEVVLFVERINLSTLNDNVYNGACLQAMRNIQAGRASDGKLFRVVMMVCGFSFLPVQMLRLGADKVLVIGQNASDETALRHLVKHNGFDDDRLIFSQGISMEMDNSWTDLFADVVDIQGCLRQNIFEDIALARVTKLSADGVVVPNRITVFGRLISSPSLMEDAKLISDERTRPFKVADFINEYQMMNHIGVELSTLAYTPVTDAFEMFSFDMNSDQYSADSSLDDLMSDPRGSYYNECTFTTRALETTTITSLVYWFELNLVEGVLVGTLDDRCHWKQATITIPKAPSVVVGDCINIRALCSNSCFNVDVTVDERRSVAS